MINNMESPMNIKQLAMKDVFNVVELVQAL